MSRRRWPWVFSVCLAVTGFVLNPPHALVAQENNTEKFIQRLEKEGCAVAQTGFKACLSDFTFDGKRVEAISFTPAGEGPFPGLLLIPGYERTARDIAPLAMRMARAGFASVAVTQPGFGKSQGPADFVGPKTLAVLTFAYRRLQKDPKVDPKRMGIYGYSRGGMAASLLVLDLDDVKAAVLGAGVYDFQRLYNDSTLPGVRANMRAETGMKKEAVIARSSILRMEQLKCPVLILHGERDVNVPVSQALMLRDRLTKLHKEFEIKLFPEAEHSIGAPAGDMALDFFERKLQR